MQCPDKHNRYLHCNDILPFVALFIHMAYRKSFKNKRMFSIHETTTTLYGSMNIICIDSLVYVYFRVQSKKCSILNWVNASLIIARVIFNNNNSIFPVDFSSIKNIIFFVENKFRVINNVRMCIRYVHRYGIVFASAF